MFCGHRLPSQGEVSLTVGFKNIQVSLTLRNSLSSQNPVIVVSNQLGVDYDAVTMREIEDDSVIALYLFPAWKAHEWQREPRCITGG